MKKSHLGFVQIGIVDAAPDLTTGFGFSWRSL